VTPESETKQQERGKPYDVWSMWCAVISLVCWGCATILTQGLEPSNMLQNGPPLGNSHTAQQAVLLFMLLFRVAVVTSLVTGIAGLFQFRKSRVLSLLALAISVPLVAIYIIQAILTAKGY